MVVPRPLAMLSGEMGLFAALIPRSTTTNCQDHCDWEIDTAYGIDAWTEQAIARVDVEPAAARIAAEYWLGVAQAEHASAASFARMSLELMAVGAPSRLLEDCHQAAMDEIGHARVALGVARTLGNPRWELGPTPVVSPRAVTLRQIAVDALVGGCIGEGGAAATANLAAEWTEGALAEVLRRIALDETRHAALAWAILRWALRRDPTLTQCVQEALDEARVERRARLGTLADGEPGLASLGVVSPAEVLCVELEVLEQIVSPVLDQLVLEVTNLPHRS